MTGDLQDLQGRAEAAFVDVLDRAETAILDNFLRAHYLRTLTADAHDHTIG
ncbi:hypothetical protein [Rhodococcus sp. WAY2]|uniref:hypothetical protein n=1 Tax=Rhodococcus sp. WAY2 TaxID=2663121 RepID=UPI00131FD1CD|nr:hypothetical protein [Rhodococcus sp. WAY2]QHE73088.1 hypothetical protein GFS60_06739 [Rhodococcus sp. WAY2]